MPASQRTRCQVCGSKRWHRVAGNQVCEEGHLMVGTLIESSQVDGGDQSRYAVTTRAQRKGRRAKGIIERHHHFQGERSVFLLWQCLQLILRQQLGIMIGDLGYPKELEGVCQELWSMLVLSSKVPHAPKKFNDHTEDPSSFSGRRHGSAPRRQRVDKRKGGPPSSSSSSGTASESEDEDERIRREMSSSDSDLDQMAEGDDRGARYDAKETPDVIVKEKNGSVDSTNERHKLKPFPSTRKPTDNPIDPLFRPRADFTLIVIYLACLHLRIPLFFNDIIQLASDCTIPFINAKRWLPQSMQDHTNLKLTRILNIPTPPNINDPAGISSWLSRMVRFYKDDWNVIFPEPNLKILTWRLCRSLACSPIIYTTTLKILDRLPSLSLALAPARLGASLPYFSNSVDRAHLDDMVVRESKVSRRGGLAEAEILAALCISLKLIYGIGSEEVLEANDDGNALLDHLPSFDKWMNTLGALSKVRAAMETPSRLWQKQVYEMSDAEIDEYLTYCEMRIVSKGDPSNGASSRLIPAYSAVSAPALLYGTPSEYQTAVQALIDDLYSPTTTALDTSRHSPTTSTSAIAGTVISLCPPQPSLIRFLQFASPLIGYAPDDLLYHVTRMETAINKLPGVHGSGGSVTSLNRQAELRLRDIWDGELARRNVLEGQFFRKRSVAKAAAKHVGVPGSHAADWVTKRVQNDIGVISAADSETTDVDD